MPQSDVLGAVRASGGELEGAIRARDAAQLVEQSCADDGLLLLPDQPMASGKTQIAELLQGMFRIGLRDLTLEVIRSEASGELSYEVGMYRMMLDLEGAGPAEEEGSYLIVHRRQIDDTWKIVASVFSSR